MVTVVSTVLVFMVELVFTFIATFGQIMRARAIKAITRSSVEPSFHVFS